MTPCRPCASFNELKGQGTGVSRERSMSGTDSLKLVARLSDVGLLFDIADLLEVVAVADAVWETSEPGCLGALRFRDTCLPVYDMRELLDWGDAASMEAGSVLAFREDDHYWGVLVDEVSGIFPAEEFLFHDVPPMLMRKGMQSYQSLALWNGEPLVCCEPEILALRRSGE